MAKAFEPRSTKVREVPDYINEQMKESREKFQQQMLKSQNSLMHSRTQEAPK